jgi:hypothetical protein
MAARNPATPAPTTRKSVLIRARLDVISPSYTLVFFIRSEMKVKP